MIFKHKQIGFTLLEVLVAFVILTIGMLGIGKMILIAHKNNSSNYIKQVAIQSAYNIIEVIRANRLSAINGNYNASNLVTTGSPVIPGMPSANCKTSTCSATQLASYDVWNWMANDLSQLPNGCGSITTVVAGINTIVRVTVQWNDNAAQSAIEQLALPSNQLIVESQL